jgi:hypothetical protein
MGGVLIELSNPLNFVAEHSKGNDEPVSLQEVFWGSE